ncbi:AKT1 [Symbiodinium microadriaticum]|nr:AKT1 [Symbiodinium microadriaticum]
MDVAGRQKQHAEFLFIRDKKLIRVFAASGFEVASIPSDVLTDVRSLKKQLHGICGFPRFRQRLLHNASILQDQMKLDSEMDLQLVTLPFAPVPMVDQMKPYLATDSGDLEQLEEFLQRPIDPNLHTFGDQGGLTLLLYAAYKGGLEAAEMLLEAGADPNLPGGPNKDTPLGVASCAGDEKMVRLLMNAGADSDQAQLLLAGALRSCAEAAAVCATGVLHPVQSQGGSVADAIGEADSVCALSVRDASQEFAFGAVWSQLWAFLGWYNAMQVVIIPWVCLWMFSSSVLGMARFARFQYQIFRISIDTLLLMFLSVAIQVEDWFTLGTQYVQCCMSKAVRKRYRLERDLRRAQTFSDYQKVLKQELEKALAADTSSKQDLSLIEPLLVDQPGGVEWSRVPNSEEYLKKLCHCLEAMCDKRVAAGETFGASELRLADWLIDRQKALGRTALYHMGVCRFLLESKSAPFARAAMVQVAQVERLSCKEETEKAKKTKARDSWILFVLICLNFFSCQFGHGSNIGVAVSLPGDSKATNLALGSFVMIGVSLGLPLTPWACRTFGEFNVVIVCTILDVIAMLLMTVPGITIHQIYAVRFLVGFFEAPFLPYLQKWLSKHGCNNWNFMNTTLHAMVPLGENVGFIVAQELDNAKYHWKWAFVGQAAVFGGTALLCLAYGGRQYLELSDDRTDSEEDLEKPTGEVEYPSTERWGVYWATNVSLAAQLGFLGGCKYVIRDYAISRGFGLHVVVFTFALIALIGPALGGSIAMSGSVVQPDKWSQHRRTLIFLACVSSTAAMLASILPYVSSTFFWPALFLTFCIAGGVYPAAQGIIQIALTRSRVIEASVYQTQCNNLLFAMPMPYGIGIAMDSWSIGASFRLVALFQVMAAAGFSLAVLSADWGEQRSTWNRLTSPSAQSAQDAASLLEEGKSPNVELMNVSDTVAKEERQEKSMDRLCADVAVQEGLMPKIVSGVSGGSIVAGFLAIHTNEEIRRIQLDDSGCIA